MITDSLIKKKFIHQLLQCGIEQIYAAQEKVITGELDTRTGQLRQWASRRQYDMRISSSGDYTINVRFYPYLRFIDMMYRGRKDRVSKSTSAPRLQYITALSMASSIAAPSPPSASASPTTAAQNAALNTTKSSVRHRSSTRASTSL